MHMSVVEVVPTSVRSSTGTTGRDEVADFEGVRRRLFAIAYRVLGGAADAEDVVQDVWIRWQRADRTQVRDREAFDHPFREIAETLGTSEANTRQLAHRARRHLTEPRHRPVDPADHTTLLTAFLDAARSGVMAPLVDLLTAPPRGRRTGSSGWS
jgi:Sigma-70 region 2